MGKKHPHISSWLTLGGLKKLHELFLSTEEHCIFRTSWGTKVSYIFKREENFKHVFIECEYWRRVYLNKKKMALKRMREKYQTFEIKGLFWELNSCLEQEKTRKGFMGSGLCSPTNSSCVTKKIMNSSSLSFLTCICPRTHWVLERIKDSNTVILEVWSPYQQHQQPGHFF